MAQGIDYANVSPAGFRAMLGMERFVRECGLEHSLIELLKIRASQLNRCGFCLDMHTKDARAAGESEQRIYLLSAWEEAPFYTPRERAALALCDAVTRIGEAGVSAELRAEALEFFSEEEMVNLVLAIITINGWNRLAITFETEVGSYQVGQH